ncbi:MAG TPA: glucuronate isomerase [Propionibacterium sp.]|jgi:glucuronate isomerase|nr:glucuronate isomerase [Propionibacterium sp.]
MSAPLELHPDRLFPAEPSTRAIARDLYASVADLPIISPHSHVPPEWIAEDIPFTDPTSLLLTPDHYVLRLLHANGIDLARFGRGRDTPLPEAEAREAFRLFCSHWPVFRGTPMRFWFEAQAVNIFGVDVRPSAGTADQIYDTIQAWIDSPASRPRALMEQFDIAVLATTDDPLDDLGHHSALRAEGYARRVVPTFRPDRFLEPARPEWNEIVDELGELTGIDVDSYAGFLSALENRRAYFKERGAVSTDHSHADLETVILSPAECERLYADARDDKLGTDECAVLRRALVTEMARMACDDGLTMTLHPAVYRNHHAETFRRFGADVGADIPISVEATRALQPMLSAYGTHPNFKVVLFTMDETTFSRELAPLAGFYPSVYLGVPWWFLDSPDAIKRFRKSTEMAGFTRSSGFIDDTRAFCSIPARHDMSRRLDAAALAELVAEHRLEVDEAAETLHHLVAVSPREVFRLDQS